MKQLKYILVEEQSAEGFQKAVNEFDKLGYQLCGNMGVVKTADVALRYYQLMVLFDDAMCDSDWI